MLIWLDLETTGLDPVQDTILEVAVIVETDNGHEEDRFQAVTGGARNIAYAKLDPYVQDMHYKNGLWMESLRSRAKVSNQDGDFFADRTLAEDRSLEARLHEFLTPFAERKTGLPFTLAGSSVHFDAGFLAEQMPTVAALFNYRLLDVSAFLELSRRLAPNVYDTRPGAFGAAAHRAMDDVENSRTTAKYFARMLQHYDQNTRQTSQGETLADNCARAVKIDEIVAAAAASVAGI